MHYYIRLHYICIVFGFCPNTRHLEKLAQSLSNHHLEIETSKRIYNWVCTISGADLTIVYSACGEPESVGESLRFFLFSADGNKGNIAQNIFIILIMRFFSFFIMMSITFSLAHAQKSVIIKAGSIVPLQAVNRVEAADVDEGYIVDFCVIRDIIVDNYTVIPKGTIAKGIVNEAKKSSIAGTKGRLTINIKNLILPSGDYLYFSNTTVRIHGKNRTPLAVATACIVWPCIFITGTKAVMPQGYEVETIVASNTEIKIE